MTSSDELVELKPCPFCGGEAKWVDDPGVCDVPFGLIVRHADFCWLNFVAIEEADIFAAWNTRSDQPLLSATHYAEERGRIVAWLHKRAWDDDRYKATDHWIEELADAIERGDHGTPHISEDV